MKSFPATWGWRPPGARPHVLVSVAEATQAHHTACAWALEQLVTPADWRCYFVQPRPAETHLTMTSANLASATVTGGQREDWCAAVAECLAGLDPFELVLGPLAVATYSVWIELDPAADAALTELSARCRTATRAVFGHDAVADPHQWTRPHVAAAHCTTARDTEELGGWLAQARTPAGDRPAWTPITVNQVVLVDQDAFTADGPRWTSAPVEVPIGRTPGQHRS